MRRCRCYCCLTCSLLGFYGKEAAVLCDRTMVNVTLMSLAYHSSSSHRNRTPCKSVSFFSRQDKCKTPCIYLLHFDRGCVCLCPAIKGWDASKTSAFIESNGLQTERKWKSEATKKKPTFRVVPGAFVL